jgi:ribulose kinase
MDVRSAKQSAQILELGFNDPALAVNCGGIGPISAEWMLPKALWIKPTEPTLWSNSAVICEMEDYLNYRLTNRCVLAAARWHWNAEGVSSPSSMCTDT